MPPFHLGFPMRAISLLPALLLFAACSETTSVRNNREEEDNTLSDTGAADTGGSGAADTGGSGADTTPVDTTPPAANTPCTVETVATDCSGGYGCDGTICYVECRDELDCQEGSTCLVPEGARYGACQPGETGPVPGETDYAFVAILSTASSQTSLLNRHPGPDIDAVEIRRDGATLAFAEIVQGQRRGAYLGSENATLDFSSITGPVDSMPIDAAGQDCAVDQPETGTAFQTYWSMGDDGGWAIVSFPGDYRFRAGDELKVWEIGPTWCANEPSGANDSYDLLVAKFDISFSSFRSAASVRAAFCPIGASGPNGDVTTISFDPAACP